MVVFKDTLIAERAEILRAHGMRQGKRYWHDYPGLNFQMTNMQAAIGVAQLGRIEKFLTNRKSVFQAYDSLLHGNKNFSLLPKNDCSENSYWLYILILNGYGEGLRDQLLFKTGLRGINARPGFYPLHQMEPYHEFVRGAYPVSSYLAANALSLPTSHGLSEQEVRHIVEVFFAELSTINRDVA